MAPLYAHVLLPHQSQQSHSIIRAVAARTDLETAELASRHLKKLKISQYQLAESPSGELRANSGLSNPLANADRSLETPLSLEKCGKEEKEKQKEAENITLLARRESWR